MENLPKHAWILCVRHNLLLAELCALRARCLLFQMLSIIVSTPSGSFKADRLYLFLSMLAKLMFLSFKFINTWIPFSIYIFIAMIFKFWNSHMSTIPNSISVPTSLVPLSFHFRILEICSTNVPYQRYSA